MVLKCQTVFSFFLCCAVISSSLYAETVDSGYPTVQPLQFPFRLLASLHEYQLEPISPETGSITEKLKLFDPDPLASPNPFTDYPSMADRYYPGPTKTYMQRSVDYLLDSHLELSDAVKIMGDRMDDYFAGDQYAGEQNKSYVKLRGANRWIEGGRLEPEFDYKFRLDLPATKRRYKLVLAYAEDNERSLEDKNRPSEEAIPQGEQAFYAGMVKSLVSESGRWETKVGGGIKVKIPPDPFVRMQGKRYFDLGDTWNSHFKSGIEWFNSDGFRWEADQIFERLVVGDLLLRLTSSLDWREELDTLEFGQRFSLYQALSEVEAIEYELGAFGASRSHSQINTYYISASYRRDLYKNLLYIQVIPEWAFLREKKFSGEASITLSLELFFR